MKQHSEGGTPTGHFLTRLGVYTANPLAFLVLMFTRQLSRKLSSGMPWPPWQPGHDFRHSACSIRYTADEILHALGDARNEITRMDEKELEEIERRREHMRKDD